MGDFTEVPSTRRHSQNHITLGICLKMKILYLVDKWQVDLTSFIQLFSMFC